MSRRGPKPKAKKPTSGSALWSGFALPDDLSDEARREFDRLVNALTAVGTLERTDPGLVLNAARISSLLTKALNLVETEGFTILAGNGTECRHPALSVVNPLTMRLRGLWSDMGLTPASSKLGDSKPSDDSNPWSGILGITG